MRVSGRWTVFLPVAHNAHALLLEAFAMSHRTPVRISRLTLGLLVLPVVIIASREAIRPIVDQNEVLFFYNNQYEGGVCDSWVFPTGAVPFIWHHIVRRRWLFAGLFAVRSFA